MKAKLISKAGVLFIAFALLFTSIVAATQISEEKNIISEPKIQSTTAIFEDDFESYEDFVIDFPPWTNIDVDGLDTYGHNTYDWPNEYDPQAFIIFNPSAIGWTGDPAIEPHSGDKFATCLAAVPPPGNDDWMISPQISIGSDNNVVFWAKSFTHNYGPEKFEVGVSTTDTNPSSFTIISTAPNEEAPLDWTEFTYDLSNYEGEDVYIGIHCISYDAFFFMVDDFAVTGSSGLSVDPGGPYTGNAGEDITFTGSASGGTPPYTYEWDFGNGDTASGQTVNYAYPAAGEYVVTLTATDDLGVGGTGTTTASIAGPELTVPTLNSGLFKLKPIIRNNGASTSDVKWRITFDGGAFINQVTEGENLEILSGSTAEIQSGFILGIGATQVTVEAWIDGGPTATRSQSGFVFLFFIKMNPGGGI
jgi:hypothetical protein